MLELKHLCFEAETDAGVRQILKDVSLTVDERMVVITGPNGSGKSTILRCIWRTNLPERGRILYDSQRFGMLDLARPRSARCCTCAPTSWATSPSSSTPCRAKPPTTSC